MEEWVGQQWHRFITRVAEPRHEAAAVSLAEMQHTLGLMFRAGGGAEAVRLAPAGERDSGGPRRWVQRLAGTGLRTSRASLAPDVLALPPRLAVCETRPLNQALYLWLAALASQFEQGGGWLADNQAATARALRAFPGLRSRHARLLEAQLAQRPDLARLPAEAARRERQVLRALRGEPLEPGLAPLPDEVAPVWLWLEADAERTAAAGPRPSDENGAEAPARPAQQDGRRRRAERVDDERHRAPLMMFFRAESILSWGEFVKVNRATDEDENPQARAVADDMARLAIARDGQSAASRVRFDLDLPSAAADDAPLGPGEQQPEWDWKRRELLPAHCAVQRFVVPEAPPFVPPPALRATARRVRRRLEVLRAAPGRQRQQTEGDEIDLDAWVRHHVESRGGPRSDSPAVYQRQQRSERSLATLLLADLSLSTDAHVWIGDAADGARRSARVIDVIRDALYVFGEALAASGDPFEVLGFSSVRRQNVRIQHLKGFEERWGAAVQARVGAIRPGYYTRMGAAIRHATARLAQRPERQRLLLLLTDGKPNDLDVYEGRWGLEDTRHAVQAARAAGLTPFAVTIDEAAHDYLPLLFGQQGYALVHRPGDLVQRLAGVHAALTRG